MRSGSHLWALLSLSPHFTSFVPSQLSAQCVSGPSIRCKNKALLRLAGKPPQLPKTKALLMPPPHARAYITVVLHVSWIQNLHDRVTGVHSPTRNNPTINNIHEMISQKAGHQAKKGISERLLSGQWGGGGRQLGKSRLPELRQNETTRSPSSWNAQNRVADMRENSRPTEATHGYSANY